MILYHGSNTAITSIDLSKCRPYKDFGKGFYLTDIEKQAEQMAERVAKIFAGTPIVTKFEYDAESAIKDENLSIKVFNTPNKEWALFVMDNRSRKNPHPVHNYDIAIGPVANDAIATLFRNFQNGMINIDMLVNGLEFRSVSNQYFFHSEKALKYIKVLP